MDSSISLKFEFTCFVIAGVAQLVERQPSKLNVAGSNPVSRSNVEKRCYNLVSLKATCVYGQDVGLEL